MEFPFTMKELEDLTKGNLYKVAEYYAVEVNKRMLKADLIDTIWAATHKASKEEKTLDEIDELILAGELPPMSARIRRIYAQNLYKE